MTSGCTVPQNKLHAPWCVEGVGRAWGGQAPDGDGACHVLGVRCSPTVPKPGVLTGVKERGENGHDEPLRVGERAFTQPSLGEPQDAASEGCTACADG